MIAKSKKFLIKLENQSDIVPLALDPKNADIDWPTIFSELNDEKTKATLALECGLHEEVRKLAILLISDENILYEVAAQDSSLICKQAAARKIKNQQKLIKLATLSPDPEIRNLIIETSNSQELYHTIAHRSTFMDDRLKALDLIEDKTVLKSLLHDAELPIRYKVFDLLIENLDDQLILKSIVFGEYSADRKELAL